MNKENKKLKEKLLKWKFKCPACNYIFNKEDIDHLLSDKEDNQSCPNCKHFIS